MASEYDKAVAVDQLADLIDTDTVEELATEVGLTVKEYMQRVAVEVTTRITGGVE